MAEGREEFEAQLRALGLKPIGAEGNLTKFAFEIPVGKFMGDCIELGFDVPGDFPRTPPSGPHVSPRLARDKGAAPGGVNTNIGDSPFGDKFEYWSRPYQGQWGRDGLTVGAYLAHIRKLLHDA